jgi:LysR family nitrogen assimilation transcriptional regulator
VPLTRRFREQLPQAQLTLTEGFSLVMLEALRSGRVDLALLYNPPASPDIERELLRQESLALLASPQSIASLGQPLKSRVPLAALAKLPLILPSRPNAFRLALEAGMNQIGLAPRIVLEVDGLNAIVDLVREGLGFAVLPPYTLAGLGQPHPLTLHAIAQPKLLSELVLVSSARRPSTDTHKAVRHLLAQTLADTVPP